MKERLNTDLLEFLEWDKQEEEANEIRKVAEQSIWTPKMLAALETGMKGKAWFSLSDKVLSEETMGLAWAKVKSNAGACGVDGITVGTYGKDSQNRLLALRAQLKDGTYQPKPVKREWIPKLGSSEKRPLGIPTVEDRIVQTAIRMVIEPIFEHEFADESYGFRPGRGCKQALRQVGQHLQNGKQHVVDVDFKGYFDTISHDKLLELVREKIADRRVLKWIEMFLKQGIQEKDGRMEKERSEKGTPQGGVISPLLANLYLNPLDWLLKNEGFSAVRYADDMVILCQTAEEANRAMECLKEWAEKAELILHPEKTKVVYLGKPREYFDFLGYRFMRGKTGSLKKFIRDKSLKKLKETIKPLTKRNSGKSLEELIHKLNQILKGFFRYFMHVSRGELNKVTGWVRGRLRGILRKREGKKGRGRGRDHQKWSNHYFDMQGLFNLEQARDHELASLREQ